MSSDCYVSKLESVVGKLALVWIRPVSTRC
jgi:hypothetical protein